MGRKGFSVSFIQTCAAKQMMHLVSRSLFSSTTRFRVFFLSFSLLAFPSCPSSVIRETRRKFEIRARVYMMKVQTCRGPAEEEGRREWTHHDDERRRDDKKECVKDVEIRKCVPLTYNTRSDDDMRQSRIMENVVLMYLKHQASDTRWGCESFLSSTCMRMFHPAAHVHVFTCTYFLLPLFLLHTFNSVSVAHPMKMFGVRTRNSSIFLRVYIRHGSFI